VQSHPVALAQCSRFFQTHPRLKSVVADDTAGSVAEVMRRGDPKRAAIAGQSAANLYGASIICKNIQDNSENYTRFVLLSKDPRSKGTQL
jgi:prephenate dehydratase